MSTVPHLRRNHLAVDTRYGLLRPRGPQSSCAGAHRHLYDAVPNWREAHEELIGFIVRDGLRR